MFSTYTDGNDYAEQNFMFMTNIEKVKKIATMVKDDILSFYDKQPIFSAWPPPEHEIKADRVSIPPMLNALIGTLLTTVESSNSDRTARLVKSFSQDIIYACSRGKLKTVKHTQLGLVRSI